MFGPDELTVLGPLSHQFVVQQHGWPAQDLYDFARVAKEQTILEHVLVSIEATTPTATMTAASAFHSIDGLRVQEEPEVNELAGS